MSRVTSLFAGKDHDNFMDQGFSDDSEQQPPPQSSWGAAPPGVTNVPKSGEMTSELAKIKAQLDAAVLKEKPVSITDKRDSRSSVPKEKAFESTPGNFASGENFANAMSPRPTTGSRRDSSPPAVSSSARSSSQKARKKKKSPEEGDVGFGADFPQSQDALGGFPASNGFGGTAAGGFADFSGGWPEPTKQSPRQSFSSPHASPPLANATRMADDALDAHAAPKSTSSTTLPFPDEADVERAAAPHAPGQFDEAILAALAALPQHSLVGVLRRLHQKRPNEVAQAFSLGAASQTQDIRDVVQSALPSKADRGGSFSGPSTQQPAAETGTGSATLASPALGFASPIPEAAMPSLTELPPPQPERKDSGGSPWLSNATATTAASSLFRVSSAPAPAQPQRIGSGAGGRPWGPPVQSATGAVAGPWTAPSAAAAEPQAAAQAAAAPSGEEQPPLGARSSQGKLWPATASPWG